MSVCPQSEACGAGRALGGGQLGIRRVVRVVPGETPADELEVDVGVAHEDARDEAAVAIDVSRDEVHDLVEDERRGQPFGGPAEGLPQLRAVDAVKADAHGLVVPKDGDRVAIVDSDDESVKRAGRGGLGGGKGNREGGGGESDGREQSRGCPVAGARAGHGRVYG